MGEYLLHQDATVLCFHAGQAQPVIPNQRVKVDGHQVVTQSSIYTISGCSLPPIAGGPCVTGQFILAATRVYADGVPVLLKNSTAVCVPPGTGVNVILTQTRVKGT